MSGMKAARQKKERGGAKKDNKDIWFNQFFLVGLGQRERERT